MRFCVLLPALLAATPSVAQEADRSVRDEGVGSDSVTIGVGGAYLPDYEGSSDYRFRPAPAAIGRVGGFGFTLAGNRGSIDLIPDRAGPGWSFQAGPIAVANFNRSSIDSVDDPRIRALGKRATTLEAGGYVGVARTGLITSAYDKLALSVSYREGVTGAHRGGTIQPTISYMTPLSTKSIASIIVSGERADRKYASAYYDVDAAGSLASGLPQFTARGGWKNYTVVLAGGYSLTGDLLHGWKIVGGVTYRRLLNDFAASPIVSVAGDRNQWLGALGVAYTF